jgi:hypothetical protein
MVDVLGAVGGVRLGGPNDDGIVCVGLYMFLEVLRTFERLAAELALVRFEGDMNTNVRSDVVTLDSGGAAVTPATGQIEVVGALAANMALAHMFLDTQVPRVSSERKTRVDRDRERPEDERGKKRKGGILT